MNRVFEEIEIDFGDIDFRRRIRGMNKYYYPFLLLEFKEYMNIKKISFDKDEGYIINPEPIYEGKIYSNKKNKMYNIRHRVKADNKRFDYNKPIINTYSILTINYWNIQMDTNNYTYQIYNNSYDDTPEEIMDRLRGMTSWELRYTMDIPDIIKLADINGFDRSKVIKKIVNKGKKNERIEYKDPNPKRRDKYGYINHTITIKDYITFLMKL
jgi:hypothetical protein